MMLALATLLACGGDQAPAPVGGKGCDAPTKDASEGQTHVTPPARVTYTVEPPSSGNHYGRWLDTGIYTEAETVLDENLVHNLEHGHVIAWYNAITPAQLGALRDFANGDKQWVLVVPRSKLPAGTVAFSAWTHRQICNAPEDVAASASAFFDAYARQAPERVAGTPR